MVLIDWEIKVMRVAFTPLLQTLRYICKVCDIHCIHGKCHPNVTLTSSRISVYLFFSSLGRKISWQCQYLYCGDYDYYFEIWPFHIYPKILMVNHTKKKRVPEISEQLELFILMLALQLSGWASQWLLPYPHSAAQRCHFVHTPHPLPQPRDVSPGRGGCSRVICRKSPWLSSSSTAGLYVSKNNMPHLNPR